MATLSYHNKRVLVVDDQRPFLILLRGIMNNLGATSVVVVQNGESAVAACRHEKFDIIISDLHLGSDKKNGYQLLEELRVRKLIKPTTIYMIVSADSDRPVVLGSVERQPDGYIIKPFSQSQLNHRLARAYQKRMTLKDIYQQIDSGQISGAIDTCLQFIRLGSRYNKVCASILIDLFWREKRFDEALQLLESLSQGSKTLPWVTIALARTYLYKGNVSKAMLLARKIAEQKLFAVEGLDILAECLAKQEELEEAVLTIQKALNMAPYSLTRQFLAVEIARQAGNFEMAKNCCQAILDQSKKSVHRSVIHLCNYIRSILDAADKAEDKKQRNRYQQEAMLVLQRNRNDELLTRTKEAFDYGIFEELVGARINLIDGKMLEAKRALNETQYDLRTRFEEYPLALAPDSLTLMCDLGEFEEAGLLLDKIKKSDLPLDSNLKYLIQVTEDKQNEIRDNYNKYNKDGIGHYAEGQYEAAYNAFLKAQELAPMNTGVALNLLQCLLKLMEKMDKSDQTLVVKCRQLYRMVDGMRLPQSHQTKFDSIKDSVKHYLERR
ncbi:response regulator [Bowmanella dokdonensis]|uniref:Response regulator n=1 Tax=Bowmanella dokdonensis TaxID=751969 RepID=A0A939DLJ9_9ALTE|nr:response regulator [Bowmanella dokdonensis]MBN7824517.1 response regulator [Bowmanella dokdonensis]